jgi:hypothetical protein
LTIAVARAGAIANPSTIRRNKDVKHASKAALPSLVPVSRRPAAFNCWRYSHTPSMVGNGCKRRSRERARRAQPFCDGSLRSASEIFEWEFQNATVLKQRDQPIIGKRATIVHLNERFGESSFRAQVLLL